MKNYKLAEISISYSCAVPKKKRKQIKGSADAYLILRENWNMETIELLEEFYIILLNRSNEVIGIFELSKGGITATIVDVKILFAVALKGLASGIILAHNHPSGNLQPSRCDLDITRKVKQGGDILDIKLLDHIILSKDGFYSFMDEGQI